MSSDECSTSTDGPDIVALGNGELWLVECKGEGSGVPQTQRNNFDRALASVVSYYGLTPYGIDAASVQRRFIALALPASQDYSKELKRRVRAELRARLDMWVLLLRPGTDALSITAPQESYSF